MKNFIPMRKRQEIQVRRVISLACITVGLAGTVAPLLAQPQQTLPEASTLQDPAQRLQRYYDQQKQVPEKPSDPLKQAAPESSTASGHALGHGASFVLRQVVFTASAFLSSAELDAAVKPFLGHPVDGTGLANLLDKVNALYAERNITTARAVFTSQPVSDGVVHIDLVEGRLGQLKIHGTPHLHDSFVRRRIHQQAGAVVDADRLRNDLVYLNRTTDLQVKALLQPGAVRGQTDILLDVAAPDRHSLDAFVDNSGVDSTGRFRVGVSGHLFGLLGVDDRLDGNIAHSKGGNDGALSYSIPVTRNNGRLGVSYSRSQINIINGAFRNLDIRGRSSVSSLQYTQPLLADMNWLINGIGQYSIGNSSTDISGQHIADSRTRLITLGTSLEHQKDGQRWSVTQLFTRIHSTEPMLGKSDFLTAPGSAFLIQRLGQSQWAVRADAGWQFSTGKNIPSANLFQLGGLGSVRGYERGVIAGSRGYYLDLELHRTFGGRLDAYGFVDHGTIYSFYPTSKSVSGVGIGALYRYHSWMTLSADLAKPLDTVIANQSGMRLDVRLAVHW